LKYEASFSSCSEFNASTPPSVMVPPFGQSLSAFAGDPVGFYHLSKRGSGFFGKVLVFAPGIWMLGASGL
jgi:hypothetical protein